LPSDWEANYKIWCTILTFGNHALTFSNLNTGTGGNPSVLVNERRDCFTNSMNCSLFHLPIPVFQLPTERELTFKGVRQATKAAIWSM